MKKVFIIGFIITLCLLITACGTRNDNAPVESEPPSTSPAAPSSSQASSGLPASAPESSAPEQSQQKESAPEPPPIQDNVTTPNNTSQQAASAPAFSEGALEDVMAYLNHTLTDEQHGGIHRTTDFNGSGLRTHGGADKADPYILVWAVDSAAVQKAVDGYSGQRITIVSVTAAYSLRQLNSILNEIQGSEIASNLNGLVLSSDNRVILDVIGADNRAKVDNFLQSYAHADAIEVFIR